jgi:Protein of unknown function (DUF2813)
MKQAVTAPESAKIPEDLEIERLIKDTATRVRVSSTMNRRYELMQRLMAKIASLSDKEFDSTYGTLEGLVEKYSQDKTSKNTKDKTQEQDPAKNVLKEIEAKLASN